MKLRMFRDALCLARQRTAAAGQTPTLPTLGAGL